MWGVSDDESNDPYAAAPVEEDDGEVIESVLDHRRKETNTGMYLSTQRISFFTHTTNTHTHNF